MAAFAPSTHIFPRPSRPSTSPCRRRIPTAVAARDERAAPSSLDELVRSWFSSVRGRPSSSGGSREEVLSGQISGPNSDTVGVAHYLLSTTIVARTGKSSEMAALLRELREAAASSTPEEGPLACAVNQSPDDPACFIVFERFRSSEAMTKYQKGSVYQKFIRGCQPLLERPLGVHICKEIDGKISQAYHPFGPAGTYAPFFVGKPIPLVAIRARCFRLTLYAFVVRSLMSGPSQERAVETI